MPQLLQYQRFYLVGIKGVAMTSLAQCLLDAGKTVSGSDVAEEFVTQAILDRLPIHLDLGFTAEIPKDVECVIYTAAHQALQNPQVQSAHQRQLPTLSQAEAIAELFNQKKGIAVCGVGGKSTTSAMIAWILEKAERQTSFSVGVGNIPGLDKTGQWRAESQYFVAEADEYVIDPSAPSRGEAITPRFSFLQPFITVCTNLAFDHPDVYRDFDHTQSVFTQFFQHIKTGGSLVINYEAKPKITTKLSVPVYTFGQSDQADFQLTEYHAAVGQTQASLQFQTQQYELRLQIPGLYNMMNAVAAIAAAHLAGVPIPESVQALTSFRSTLRRSEFIGEKHGVRFYDDYAHHPNEVQQVIHAFREWFPTARLVVAFQSHTFSRTKALFLEFVQAFGEASEVAMIDIFPSAREAFDPTVTSDLLCEAIQKQFPHIKAHNYQTLTDLAEYLHKNLQPGDVCLTVGAGDIYQVHSLLQ